jgi:hypothetical protein
MFGRMTVLPVESDKVQKNIKKFLTAAICKAFDKQGDTSEKDVNEIKTVVKLFSPYAGGTWWLYERIDEDTFMAFVNLGDPTCAELGTVSISELASMFLGGTVPVVERDRHYTPEVLEDVINRVKALV